MKISADGIIQPAMPLSNTAGRKKLTAR